MPNESAFTTSLPHTPEKPDFDTCGRSAPDPRDGRERHAGQKF